ncbi:MAG: tetratricopeptide repeat protein [Bacteroidota bacterium]
MINATDKQLYLAARLLKEGQVEECINELSLLLLRYPDHGRGNALMGQVFMHHFLDYSNAEACFTKALRFDPLNPTLYSDFAELLILLEKYTEAIAVINKGFEIPGIEKEKLFRLSGLIHEKQQDFDQAIAFYTDGILQSMSESNIKKLQADIQRCMLKKRI